MLLLVSLLFIIVINPYSLFKINLFKILVCLLYITVKIYGRTIISMIECSVTSTNYCTGANHCIGVNNCKGTNLCLFRGLLTIMSTQRSSCNH